MNEYYNRHGEGRCYKDMAVDPDTCEIQHPSKVLHKLDVSNVRLSNVCMYAYKHNEGMKKPERED